MAISSNGLAGLKPGVVDNAAARPSSPFEGQMVYEKDIDMLAIWNGTAWRYIAATTPTNGTVLQVITGTYSTSVSLSSSLQDTGLTATITPKSATSSIFVSVSQGGCGKEAGNSNSGISLKLYRGATDLGFIVYRSAETNTSVRNIAGQQTAFYLDTPATTSATTYKTMFANSGTGGTDGVVVQFANARSSITLMEIAG
jgi:hypothetical protein